MTAFSGYGIMASPAAAEVLAAVVLGESAPAWGAAFDPARLAGAGAVTASADDGQL